MSTKIYVTKYAATKGIIEGQVERFTEDGKRVRLAGRSHALYAIGREAFTDEAAAKTNAEDRIKGTIAALQRKIAALTKRLENGV